MAGLDSVTRRRLMKIPQAMAVWEGDRRNLYALQVVTDEPPQEPEYYVIWMDGTQGALRSMLPVESSDLDAIVQALVQGMEMPPNGTEPARPKKIVVRDREIYLYLQSIAQDLKITLELVPELSMVDQVFEKFQEFREDPSGWVSSLYGELFAETAKKIFKTAPWVFFGDHQILEVELNQWGLGTVYVSTMGNAGLDFGLLVYRSLESFKVFRDYAVNPGTLEEMEAAFVAQDCMFLNYEFDKPMRMMPELTRFISYDDQVELSLGSLGEGLRPFLTDDETIAFAIILEATHCFIEKNRSKFSQGKFPELTLRHQIPVPETAGIASPLTVKVSTMPKLAAEFMDAQDDDDDGELFRDDLFPKNAEITFTLMDWSSLEILRSKASHHQPLKKAVKPVGSGFPVVVVETSPQSAKRIINEINALGGLEGIGFNPGRDMLGGQVQLALLKAMDDTLFLFHEVDDDGDDDSVFENWKRFSRITKNYCALVIAKKSKNKGHRDIQDTIALYELKALPKKVFGLGVVRSEIGSALDFLFR